jgi:hypothetical protein
MEVLVPDTKIATTWALLEATFDELVWAHSIGVQVTVSQETVDVDFTMQSMKMALGKQLIEVYSESEEINTLLRLKFTDRLIKVKSECVLSRDTCTLSELTF